MKRMLFGIMLSFVGLSYSLVCFHSIISNPWTCSTTDGVLWAFLDTNTLLPFLFSSSLLLVGLILILFEAYRKK